MQKHTAVNLVARAGEWDLSTDLEIERHVEKHVINVVIHEDFNPKSLVNDVSLLFLNDSFVMTEHINVICLPSQDFSFDGSKCIATGWGNY